MTGLIVRKMYFAGAGFERHPNAKLMLLLVETQALNTIAMVLYLILFSLEVSVLIDSSPIGD